MSCFEFAVFDALQNVSKARMCIKSRNPLDKKNKCLFIIS